MGKLYSLILALLMAVSSVTAAEPAGYEWWFDNDVSTRQTGTVTGERFDIPIDLSDLSKGAHYFNCRLTSDDGTSGSIYRKMFFTADNTAGAVAYEYWFDNDYAAKQRGDISSEKISLQIDDSLTPGMHYFNCRLYSNRSGWGAVYRKTFFTVDNTAGAVSYEYWFDNAYAEKQSGPLTAGVMSFEVDASPLTPGLHYFNCRLLNNNGEWGSAYHQMVFIGGLTTDAKVFEYWIDDNYDSKVTGELASMVNTYVVNLQGVRKGVHCFNYRLGTDEGVWGSVYSKHFFYSTGWAPFSSYEYWFDDDYANRKSGTTTTNPANFEVDLNGFDKSGGAHFFTLRVRDDDGDWSSVYRRLLVFHTDSVKSPVIGYRHRANGVDLGYVNVERKITDAYTFDIDLPEGLGFNVNGKELKFDGDNVSVGSNDTIHYDMQIRTELGWAPTQTWDIPASYSFSTTATEMGVNTYKTFAMPSVKEFVAVKFTAGEEPLYFLSDKGLALDIYSDGEKVSEIPAADVKGLAMVELEPGEYFAILHDSEDTDAEEFTLHLMDTPNIVPTPTIEFRDGNVAITCRRDDAVIYYTIDGSVPQPDAEGTSLYSDPFPLDHNTMVRAMAIVPESDITPSLIAEYNVSYYKVGDPVISFENLMLVITPDQGAGVHTHYTLNGTEPTEESEQYNAPFSLSGNVRVRARSFREGYNPSEIVDYVYTHSVYITGMPEISMEGNMVTLTATTDGSTLYYSIDNPDTSSMTEYTSPFELTGNGTIYAQARKAAMYDSEVQTLAVTDRTVPTPTASFGNKVLTLTCEDPEAQIRYTTDNSEPTASSTLYEGPISLTEDCVVRFIATRDRFNDSPAGSFVFVLVTYRVEAPSFNYDAANKTMTMSCNTERASIRYTTDGTVPEENTGTLYEGPVEVTGNQTFTARGFRNDLFPSTPAVLSINDQSVPIPTAEFANLRLTLTCDDEDAAIYYTIDGSTPTEQSTLYTEPVALTEDCTVKFIGVRENFNNSPVGSYNFVRSYFAVAKPTFTYDSESRMVSISTETEGAEIRYTTDGTEPTETTGTVFTEPIEVVGNLILTARGFKENFFGSEAATLPIDDQKVPDPVASFGNRVLTITCPDAQARIYYTTDGNEPTAASTLYESPVSLTRNCTVRMIAIRENFINSEIIDFPFVYDTYRVAAPTLNYEAGDKTVEMRCATEGAEIRYTTDGSEPTATTGNVYSEPVAIIGNQTFTVMGFRTDLFDSEPAILKITDQTVPTPTASFANLRLTLACEDPEASIYYTTDDTEPSAASTLYTEPVALTQNCTVRFVAVRENFNNSSVEKYDFIRADFTVAKPTVSYTSETHTVTLATTTANANIRYTTDGTVPTLENGESYSTPFAATRNGIITAAAFRNDLFASDTTVYKVTDMRVPTPTYNFAELKLTLDCEDSDAQIRYTTSGTDPTAASTLYEEPLTFTGDCVVKFIAQRQDFNDSELVTYTHRYADYQVAAPVFNFDRSNLTLTMTTATDGAEIRYTIDGTEPTQADGILYEGPVAVVGNHTFKARAFKVNMYPSEISSLPIDDQKVSTPVATFVNRVLTITCPDAEAKIYYTLDGTDPTTASAVYESSLPLREDCTVKFFAVNDNFIDSDIKEFKFIYDDYRVATPKPSFDVAQKTMTLTCDTERAAMRYTIDGSEPTAEHGTVYTEPVKVAGNCLFRAIAYREDLFDSYVATRDVNELKVPDPKATFADLRLTLACDDDKAQIRYTTDGSNPTEGSTLYRTPLTFTGDCTVKFFAHRENFRNSEVVSYVHVYSDHQVKKPSIAYNTETHIITMSTDTDNAAIRYTTDGTEPTAETGTLYTEPFRAQSNCIIKAGAFRQGMYPSEIEPREVKDLKVKNPTASFANLRLTLSCEDSDAVNTAIHYTTDGNNPNPVFALYEEPLTFTGDRVVKFFVTCDNLNNSDTISYTHRYADYQVKAPAFNFDRERMTVSISTETENAVIRYTTDGSDPTEENGIIYDKEIPVPHNIVFKARAFKENLYPSVVATLPILDLKVKKPTAKYDTRCVVLTCPDPLAQIRYTTDGNAPTGESPVYDKPIPMSDDCMVRFYATRANYLDSDPDEYKFIKADHTVENPKLHYDSATRLMEMSCATDNAVIRYTTDGTAPTATTGIVYENKKVNVVGNLTFRAAAFRADLFDSDIVEAKVTDQRVRKPTARYSHRSIILECADPEAKIYYTINSNGEINSDGEPSAESTPYNGAIAVSEDCIIRFVAVRDKFINTVGDPYVFELAAHQEAAPTFRMDYRDRKVMITHKDSLDVRVTIGNTVEVYNTPTEIDVTPDFKTLSAVAVSVNPDTYDSAPADSLLVFHLAPTFEYDGHTLTTTLASDDPVKGKALISFNGGEPVSEKMEVKGFGKVTARVESDNAFRSEPAEMDIDYFNTGTKAGARNGHRLNEGFGSWGDNNAIYTDLEVVGELEKADLAFVATLPQLTTLTLNPDEMITEACDSIFANTRIETITLPGAPKGILKGIARLTTVVWNSTEVMPEEAVTDAANPNLLLWVDSEESAPANAVNVVANGEAATIRLQAGFPFNAHRQFRVGNIELTKEFSQKTSPDTCQGWETLVVPFTPETIRHESKGEIIPFAKWNEEDEEGPKPFWLYSSTSLGWKAADRIEAHEPYIISMPNYYDYLEAYQLAGKITFEADNVVLGPADNGELDPTANVPKAVDWAEGRKFVGTYMPVDDATILSLNVPMPDVAAHNEDRPGSKFVPNGKTLPMGAYLTTAGDSRKVPVFSDGTGITLPTVTRHGIIVEAIGIGTLRISSTRTCTVGVYTPAGVMMRSVDINASESVIVDDLAKGIYIVAGCKIMVD